VDSPDGAREDGLLAAALAAMPAAAAGSDMDPAPSEESAATAPAALPSAARLQEPPPASSLAEGGGQARLARVRLRAPAGTRVVTAGGQVLAIDEPIPLAAGPLELRLHCPRRRRPYSHWLRIAPDQAALQTFRLECENKPLK
jgi:hypothetical protein